MSILPLKEIQAHIAEVVHIKVQDAIKWAVLRFNGKKEDFHKQMSSSKLAIICHLYETMKEFSSRKTLEEHISDLSTRKSDDITTWLAESFAFHDEEIDNFLALHWKYDIDKFFTAVRLNEKYDLLLKAALRQDTELMQWLITNGVDINAKNEDGSTPLHIAADRDNKDAVKFLLSYGADCFALDANLEVPFDKALQSYKGGDESFSTADLLLPYVFASRLLPGSHDMRLHKTVQEGDELRVWYLLDRGASVHARNKDGHTALYIAVKKNYPKIVRILLEKGADASKISFIRNDDQETFKTSTEIKQILFAVGVDLED